MTRILRANRIWIGLIGVLGVISAGFAFWYWASGDATTVLAALIEPTPTTLANAAPRRSPTEQAQRKQEKQRAKAEIAAGAFGTLRTVDGQTITLQAGDGSTSQVTLGDRDRLIVVGTPNATAADLESGDKILVIGAKNGTGSPETIQPRVIVSAPGNYSQENVLLGQVASVSTSGLQITTMAGPKTITLANSAQVSGIGFQSANTSKLKSNTNVIVFGEPQADQTFAAQVVLSLPRVDARAGMSKQERKTQKHAVKTQRKQTKRAAKAQNQQPTTTQAASDKIPGAFGSVTALSGSQLQVQTELRGAKTFVLDSQTKIIVAGKPNPTASDIQTGSKVVVIGGGKKRPALVVLAAPATYTLDNLTAGKIRSVSATGIIVKTKREASDIALASETQIFKRDGSALKQADLLAKQRVLAVGSPGKLGDIKAQLILVLGKY